MCDSCNKDFKTKFNLERHQASTLCNVPFDIEIENFKCDDCDLFFSKHSNLKRRIERDCHRDTLVN